MGYASVAGNVACWGPPQSRVKQLIRFVRQVHSHKHGVTKSPFTPALGSETPLTGFPPCGFLATTLSFYHGIQSTTLRCGRWGYFNIEGGHRSLKSYKGGREYHTREGCLWLHQRNTRNDQSEPRGFLLTDCRLKGPTSNLGWLVLRCITPSTGDWVSWMSSANRYTRRSSI